MFEIDEKTKRIQVTRGDSCALLTYFYVNEEEQPHVISGNECVVFTVKSRESGVLKIRRILTERDCDDGALSFEITPQETLIPFDEYEYSFLYLPDKNTPNNAYTYAQGIFEILHSVSIFKDGAGEETNPRYELQEKSVTPSTMNETVLPDSDYYGLSAVHVRKMRLQSKIASAGTNENEVIPDIGYEGLSSVIIPPVTSSVDGNIVPENIRRGVTILGVTGTYEGGTS